MIQSKYNTSKEGRILQQLKLEFSIEKSELPLDLDRLIVSFFKASLQNYSEELFLKLYNKKESIVKSFCFSVYLPGAKFTKERIQLNRNSFSISFSDANLGELIHFFNAFQMMRGEPYPMNGNSMCLQKIYAQKMQKIAETEIIIKMKSSLIVREHHSENNSDIFYTYEDKEFSECLKRNVEILLQRLELPFSVNGFSITPIKGKKIVANIFGRKIDGSIGIFRLTGETQLLNFLYAAGIGTRRSAGHGKFEIVW